MITKELRTKTLQTGARIAKRLQVDDNYAFRQIRYDLLFKVLMPRNCPPLHPLVKAKCSDDLIIAVLSKIVDTAISHERLAELSRANIRGRLKRLLKSSSGFQKLIDENRDLKYVIAPGLIANVLDQLASIHNGLEQKIRDALKLVPQKQYRTANRIQNVLAFSIQNDIKKMCKVDAPPLVVGLMNSLMDCNFTLDRLAKLNEKSPPRKKEKA